VCLSLIKSTRGWESRFCYPIGLAGYPKREQAQSLSLPKFGVEPSFEIAATASSDWRSVADGIEKVATELRKKKGARIG
jgi:hypothetical protein